jgi:hypothetical protein
MSKPRRRNAKARKTSAQPKLTDSEIRDLKNKRQKNMEILREERKATGSEVIARTQAGNRKSSATTVESQQLIYEEIVSAQIDVWRALLPNLIRKFSKIKDPRNPGKLKHSITVLMVFGLFLFVFKIKSRRDFNEQLTGPGILNLLESIFPEITTIPHADTIARLLERIDPSEIEKAHVSMIQKLIKNKKFKKLLIEGRFPISIDGTQKMTRDDQLQEGGWQLRTIYTKEGRKYQQYVYVLEANLTFFNGINIPLLTEYCFLDTSEQPTEKTKKECELNAFYRLSDKIKKYFPRLKIMMILDNLYACENVIDFLEKKKWDFMIKLPAKVKSLYNLLNGYGTGSGHLTYRMCYREREQTFFWVNEVNYRGHMIHLVRCDDQWREVSRTTGEIITKRSVHTWISSMALSTANVHMLCNLAARKRSFIEDNFNTEKNRGYQYQHVFSYHWNAMKAFHYLMRLGHMLNALSEFTKRLKRYIKSIGVSNTMSRIFEAIKHCWISPEFIEEQLKKTPQLKLDFNP